VKYYGARISKIHVVRSGSITFLDESAALWNAAYFLAVYAGTIILEIKQHAMPRERIYNDRSNKVMITVIALLSLVTGERML